MSDSDRHETPAERLDRNWIELLNELRVAQTGVQVMAGFLLTLPFTERFGSLPDGYRAVYLTAFGFALLATAFIIAPTALHRALYAQHEKSRVVHASDVFAKIGTACLAGALVAVTVLIFGVTLSTWVGCTAGAVTLVLTASLWWGVPRLLHG